MQNTYNTEEPASETVPFFSPPTSRPTAHQSYYGGALPSLGEGQPQVRTLASWFTSAASLQPTTVSDGAVPVAPWGIHWYTPASIVFLLVIGIASAIGHHIFYNTFDGKLAGDGKKQEWVIRTGTALAFLCHASLGAAVGISRKQWVWRTLRKRSVTLGGIDAIFGVSSDPLFFFNLEIFRWAKVSTVMALVMWMIPIVAIFTPGTISVYGERPAPTNCVVPSLKFEYDNKPSVFTSGGINSTLGRTNSSGYTGPTSIADYIVRSVLFSGRALPADTWPPNVTTLDKACGTSKCAYEIQFQGPALKCEEKIPWDVAGAPWENRPDDEDLGYDYYSYRAEKSTSSRDSFWIQHLYEGRNHTYLCKSSVARYSMGLTISNKTFLEPIVKAVDDIYNLPDSIESNLANMTASYALFDSLVNVLSGSIRTRKVCGGSTGANADADTSVAMPTTTNILTGVTLNTFSTRSPGPYPTSPAMDTSTTSAATNTKTTNTTYTKAPTTTTPTSEVKTSTGITEITYSTKSPTTTTPTSEVIVNTEITATTSDPPIVTVVYFAPPHTNTGIGVVKRDGEENSGIKCGQGQIIRNAVSINRTQIHLSALSGTNTRGEEGAHTPFLGQAIEDIFQKSIASLLSAKSLKYAANVTTTCQHVESVNKYRYDVRKLASIYAILVAVVVVTATVGFFALVANGVASDENFSTVLLTTRNPSLDMLTVGSCLGGNPLPKDIAKLRLRFGETPGMVGVNGIGKRHAAFGVEGEVSQIRVNQDYS